jgi:glycosyltransferase involved in cell wall biosynthesis
MNPVSHVRSVCVVKISILSAAHNEEQFIGEMIESVIRQTHTDLELLIVDDRSTDKTSEIAHEFAARDERVHVVPSTDVAGKNSAWNRAFEVSTGDAVVYMGADDVLPPDSLALRSAPLATVDPLIQPVATFSKIRMFSDDPRFDGKVYPRGKRGSRVGGTLTMSRALAELIFPVSTELPNEDLWGAMIVELRAQEIFEVPLIVYNYRIHSGNSFHLGQSFDDSNWALVARNCVYQKLLDCERYGWTARERQYLESRRDLEELRRTGRVLGIASRRGINPKTKLSMLSHSSRHLYAIRQRFYSLSSGW